ncbi:MAG: tyrosine-type recombinase/integrase [Candidatus Omnitrophota bacterium]|nr:MAG: tyrosine-type recombinase/integrase [Candidatus Omnitrophota bacterium]
MKDNSLYNAKEMFLSGLKASGRVSFTIENYQRSLRYFFHFLEEKKIGLVQEVSQDVIAQYQDYAYEKMDYSEKTLAFYINDIRRFFDYLIRQGIVCANPVKDVHIKQKRVERVEVITRYYSLEEIVRKYKQHLKTKGVSFNFYEIELVNLNTFIYFLNKTGINSIYKVTSSQIEGYKEYLNSDTYFDDGKYLNSLCQIGKLRSLRRFYKWLLKEKMIKNDSTAYLDIGRHQRFLKGQKRKSANQEEPKSQIQLYIDKFLEYKQSLGLSDATIRRLKCHLNVFSSFLRQRNLTFVEAIRKEDILCYLIYLSNVYTTPFGKHLAQATKTGLMSTVRQFFAFLYRFEYIQKDPVLTIESLKSDQGIPRTLMSQREVNTILDMPDLTRPLGIRDKAVLETLFSTGMRASELCYLKKDDIDFVQGLVRINHAKGGRPMQRIVPIGRIALYYINLYVNHSRDFFLNGHPGILFLSKSGKLLSHNDLREMIKGYSFKAGFRKNITTHSFRVTCATEMLKNKADIRYVQQQLGHKKITSTQIYTRLAPVDLKIVHQKTHPREKAAGNNTP